MNLLFIYNQMNELSSVEQNLSIQNHKIYISQNLNEAMNTLSRIKIDIIFCDLVSENIDGIQILRRFKTSQTLSAIPFVFISSALTDEEDDKFFKKMGALGTIEKPVTSKGVQQIIDRLINKPELGFDANNKIISDEEFFEEYSNILTKRIQRRVRDLESDQLFIRNLIDSIPSAIFLIDRNFKIYDLNEVALRYIGLNSKDDVRGKNCYSVLYKSNNICNFEGHRCPILAVIQEGKTTEHFLNVDIDNSRRYLNIHFAPILNPQENSVMLLENISDNTGMLELIEKTRESEFKLEAILNESRYGIILIENEQVLIFNPPALELLGITEKSIDGIRGILGAETYQELMNAIDQNIIFHREIFLPRDISAKILMCEAQKIDYKDRTFALIILYDYTENYRLMERIRESELLFRTILDNVQDIFVLVHDNRIVEVSRQVESISGKKRDLLIRQNIYSALPFIKESYLIDTTDKEFEITTRDGVERVFSLKIFSLNIKENRHILLQITDMTEQRERERTKEIQSAKMQYIDRLEVAGKMMNGITHNINNILTGISNFSEYLIRSEQPYDRVKTTADIIKKLSRNAANIINRVSNLMKIEQREYRPVDIQGIIDELVELMRDTFPKNIQVEVIRDSVDNIIEGDFNSLFQSFLNILINSKEAMPDGGKITISTKNIIEEESGGEGTKYVQIIISDTGIGIDDTIKKNIFTPYFSSKNCPGSGLGLSIVYNTVRNHKGRVDFESSKGKGTAFVVSLPVSQKQVEDGRVFASDELSGNREKILIVSENNLERDILKRVLLRHNYDAYTAIDSIDAIESLKVTKPNIIIIDSNLQRLTPIDTFQKILQIYPDIQIILFTGLVLDEVTIELISQGIEAIIYKPIDIKEVLSTVRSNLNREHTEKVTREIAAVAAPKKKILIVDDEEYILSALKMNLSDNFDIQIETSGAKALDRILNNEEFHRFILDINMPDMNGLEFYRMMKEVYSDLDKRVIFITGGVVQEKLIEELKTIENEVSLLQKPFDIDDLMKLL